MKRKKISHNFKTRIPSEHSTLREVLIDGKLAEFGDSYVNFIYSLALSMKEGVPQGTRVQGMILSQALRKANLRGFLPNRSDRHIQADAAEALIAFSWIRGTVTLEESFNILLDDLNEPSEAFSALLKLIIERLSW
jgi:hypothetical protein